MLQRFAAADDWLAERYDAAIVITGGDACATCEDVRSMMRRPALNVARRAPATRAGRWPPH